MRSWLFHPLIFYPLLALVAALVTLASLQPQAWPRKPAPVAGEIHNGMLVLQGAAFNSPDPDPEQRLNVDRDFWGHPQSLHVAVIANQPPPTPAETGVRILLTPQAAQALGAGDVTVEVSYRPQAVNNASSFAVSLQGIGPADWVTMPVQPQAGVLHFNLPPGFAPDAIGLRAISTANDEAYGIEITRIVAYPSRTPATPPPTLAPASSASSTQTSQPAAGH